MKFSLKVIEEELLLDFIDNREKIRDDARIKIQKVPLKIHSLVKSYCMHHILGRIN